MNALKGIRLLGLALLLVSCAVRTGGDGSAVRGPGSTDGAVTIVSREPLAAAGTGEHAAEVAAPLAPIEPPGDPYATVDAGDPALAETVRQSRWHYDRARLSFSAGDIDTARSEFNRAVDALALGPGSERPEAQALADALGEQVAAYEAAWQEAESGDPGDDAAEPATSDAITEVDLPVASGETQPVAAAVASPLYRDVPLEMNNQVEYMLELYKGRLKDEITPAFVRAGRFLPMVQTIFREEGVPLDLAWLALVESGFKAHAYSRARAKGLWQFISATGRLYGLDSDYWVDERSDPIKATRAAARHLRDLHDRYGDWYLSLAAYNAGAGKVDRAIRNVGSRDYWAIARTRHLKRETKNYVPAFLATLLIVEDPAKHGFDFVPEIGWTYDEAEINAPADLDVLARCAGTSEEELRRLNPELRTSITPPNVPTYRLRIPIGSRDRFLGQYALLTPNQRLRYASHQVRPGETLSLIAGRYGVSVDTIAQLNHIARRNRIAVGTELVVPLSRGIHPPVAMASMTSRRSDSSRSSPRAYHRVQRGDTLFKISRRYGVSVSELRRLNGLRSDRIVAGTRLKVPGAVARMRTR